MATVPWLSSIAAAAEHKINELRPPKTVCNLPSEERMAGRRHHPNMLIEGPESSVEQTLVALASDFYPDVYQWPNAPKERLVGHGSTIIIRDVTNLDARGQQDLEAWLEQAGSHIQIVSTSSAPLYELVERGSFRVGLYYRLNTLRIVIDGQSRTNPVPRADH